MIEKAIIFAAEHHEGQRRKLLDIPYIYHPVEVMMIVRGMTGDEEVIAAAVLHDTVEDTSATMEDIRENFGERVAYLVACESENKRKGQSEEATWKIRKQETVDHIKNIPLEAKMITLADKLSNLRSMRSMQLQVGDELFKAFHNSNKEDHHWYYESLMNGMQELAGYDEYKECRRLISEIFGGDDK